MTTYTDNKKLKPFLKWAGGKRWFIVNHKDIIPSFSGKYIEPFLGSGVVFFHLNPTKAILSDLNSDLITTYKAIKEDYQQLTQVFNNLKRQDFDYYEVREWQPNNIYDIAARFIYLNRTCWNGLYRVNLKGQFNVPKGTNSIHKYPEDNFKQIADALKKASLRNENFTRIIGYARKGDFIFADPPYTVRHNNNGFVKYNEKLFAWEDQVKLADSLARAVGRGCKVICTNANHESIKQLYSLELFKLKEVSRYSSISPSSQSRKNFKELIIESRNDE